MDLAGVNMSFFIPAMIVAGVIIALHATGVICKGVIGRIASYLNIFVHLGFIYLLMLSNLKIEALTLCIMSSLLVYSALSYIVYRRRGGRGASGEGNV